MPLHGNKVIYIPHEMKPIGSVRQTEHTAEDGFVLGYLGRLDIDQKGLDILIDAFCSLKTDRIVRLVIGGPDYHGGKAILEKLIPKRVRQCGLISFSGPVYGDEKERWFNGIDLYVQPSKYEGFGISIAEAMQRGKPVLVSNKCNISGEVLSVGAGFECSPTVGSVRHAMLRAIETNPEDLRRMGEAGRHWVSSTCSIEAVAKTTMQLLNDIVVKSRHYLGSCKPR